MTPELLLPQFRLRFPEFASASDDIVLLYLSDAILELSLQVWTRYYEKGVLHHAAHHLAISGQCPDVQSSGAGPVQSRSVGDVSVSFGGVAFGTTGETFWTQTKYGCEYLRLLNLVSNGFFVVTGAP